MRGLWRIKLFLSAMSKWKEDSLILLKAPLVLRIQCPICDRKATKVLCFGVPECIDGPVLSNPQVQSHEKHVCLLCGHYFTRWLDGSLDRVAALYGGIERLPLSEQPENERSRYQLGLLHYAVAHLGARPGAGLLDFGCGPNRSPTYTMRALGYDAHCCDILERYPYDDDTFFRHDLAETRWFGRFDAITSIDVIEHLGNTIHVWKYLNRLLRPNGIMAHCFPSRFHYRLRSWYCTHPFHVCFFSRRSLRILMRKTGFRLEAIEEFRADVPYVFRFRKVREVDLVQEQVTARSHGQPIDV